MRQTFFFLIFTLIINLIFAQNQQVNIEYSLKLNRETSSKKSKFIRAFENQKFQLIASESESLFFGIKKLNSNVTRAEKLASIFSGNKDVFYSNTKYIIVEKEISGNKLLIKKEKNFLQWNLSKEKKTIGKYMCYKATGKILETNYKNEQKESQVVAWYCPQINYSFGPMGYNGLSGVILELQISKTIYYATRVVIKKESINKIEEPTEGRIMTEIQFNEFSKKLYENRKL